jgi:hypothetical protein
MDGNGVLETYKEPPGRITGYPEVTLSNPGSFQNQVFPESPGPAALAVKNQHVAQSVAGEVFGKTVHEMCQKTLSEAIPKPQVLQRRHVYRFLLCVIYSPASI